MKILVVDVAAEKGGALTIFEQFRKEFEEDIENEYVCLVSIPRYENTANVRYVRLPWVKKSYLHRLWFDKFYIKKVMRAEKPQRVLSLQNKCVSAGKVFQDVYFHNVLLIDEKKYSLKESKKLWVYQNVIAPLVRKSLKKADTVYVQAEWIKNALGKTWGIAKEKIKVKRPVCSMSAELSERKEEEGLSLFYPANFADYKNHKTLLKACKAVWDEKGKDCGLTLTLTGDKKDLPEALRAILGDESYPVDFCGRLTAEEMKEMYLRTSLVFPSVLETVGLPLAEAKNCGCMIFASDMEYAAETVGDYEKVRYFDPKNPDALAKILMGSLN